MSQNDKPLLIGQTLPELKEALTSAGLKAFSADQIFQWLYRHFEYDLDKWTNISKSAKTFIQENYSLSVPKVVWQGSSKDGTRKFLVAFSDQNSVETVMIPSRDRATLCVSSQVGCAIGCTFCHTGTMGLKRHLDAGEIVGQLVAVTLWMRKNVDPEFKLTNIVYMGQGEPLHNFKNVKTATEVIMEEKGMSMGQRRITLSTSGLVPQIKKLWDFPPVNIAISLHAAHDNVRTELMPINQVFDLRRLFEAIKEIPLKAHRRITYEYILIEGLNDRQEDIDGLVELLDKKLSKVNIIPFNEHPGSKFKRPSNNKIHWFQKQLLDRDYVCTIRTTRGDDILAACGQLKSLEDELNLWNRPKKEDYGIKITDDLKAGAQYLASATSEHPSQS